MNRRKRRWKDGIPLHDNTRKWKIFGIVLTSIIVASAAAFSAYKITAGIHNYKENAKLSTVMTENSTESTTLTANNTGISFIYKECNVKDSGFGNLIVVNNDHAYLNSENENIVSVFDEREELKSGDSYSFEISNKQVCLDKSCCDAMIKMLDDFYKSTKIDDVMIVSGYRSHSQQQALYDEDLKNTGLNYSVRVAIPGYSEHETGLAFDLDLVEGEYDGTGDYDWINKNCKKYGLILRYPKDKSNITQIEYESWHYRYVGMPSAVYIEDNSICLEEYSEILKKYYSVSDFGYSVLNVTGSDGHIYGIYYTPSAKFIPVPKDYDYEISGSNTGGFIITFDTKKKAAYKSQKDSKASKYVEEENTESLSESSSDPKAEEISTEN